MCCSPDSRVEGEIIVKGGARNLDQIGCSIYSHIHHELLQGSLRLV